MSLPLAIKYRPQTFGDLIGNSEIVEVLRNSILTKSVRNSYFLYAVRGSGKTTMARIFGRAINCSDIQKDGSPCNKCDRCLSILDGSNPDFVELDAASENSVENIRSLIKSISFPPISLDKKVIIIDECHALSRHAASALLKTLEEPPEYVVFILATTDMHKVIPTIISRSIYFSYKPVGTGEIKKRLRFICDNESIEVNDDALELIAIESYGLVRDSIVLLEHFILFDGVVTKEVVLNTLGRVSFEECFNFIKLALDKNIDSMYSWFYNKMNTFNFIDIINSLLSFINNLVIVKFIPSGFSVFSESISLLIKDSVGDYSLEFLNLLIDEFKSVIKESTKVRFINSNYLVTMLVMKLSVKQETVKQEECVSLSSFISSSGGSIDIKSIFNSAKLINLVEGDKKEVFNE